VATCLCSPPSSQKIKGRRYKRVPKCCILRHRRNSRFVHDPRHRVPPQGTMALFPASPSSPAPFSLVHPHLPCETRDHVQLKHEILCPQRHGKAPRRPSACMGGPLQEDTCVRSVAMREELVGGRVDPQRHHHKRVKMEHVGVQGAQAATVPSCGNKAVAA